MQLCYHWAELEAPLLVAMTGYGQAEDRHRAQAAGFDEHLVKPADLDRLKALMADYPRRKASNAVEIS